MLAPAADHVVPFVELREQHRKILGRMLQVAVHGDDDPAPRLVEPGCERSRLAVVARELHDPDAGIDRGHRTQVPVRPVDAAIVDKDDFVGEPDCTEDGGQALVQLLERGAFVIKRNDDRQLRVARRH